jgi:hypothetical protein
MQKIKILKMASLSDYDFLLVIVEQIYGFIESLLLLLLLLYYYYCDICELGKLNSIH